MTEEKYADLAARIKRDRTQGRVTGLGETEYALLWLDEHPEAVPSSPAKPTITESEIAKAFGPEYVAWARMCLARIGVTVVPDPEPTNAELLERLLLDLELVSDPTERKNMAEALSAEGVKAPGDDDD